MLENQASRAATANELAALKALLAPDAGKNPTGAYAGFTAAQVVAAINAPRTVPNPAPQGTIALASIPTAQMEELLLSYLTPVLELAATTTDAPTKTFCAIYQAKLAAFQASSLTSVPVNASLAADIALMVQYGILAAPAAAALTVQPDPAYQATIAGGPLSFQVFGSPTLAEAADVTAALAS